MPRPIKKAKSKAAKPPGSEQPGDIGPEVASAPSVAVADPPPAEEPPPGVPPSTAQETNDNAIAEPISQPQRRQRPSPPRASDQASSEQPAPRKPAPFPAQRTDGRSGDEKDHIAATSINIAKLQAMSMSEL